jgi:hypothetical protein
MNGGGRNLKWARRMVGRDNAAVRHRSVVVEILKDNARPEAGAVYAAMDMPWAKLVGQIALPDHFECATASSPLSKHRSPGSDSIQTDLGSVLAAWR